MQRHGVKRSSTAQRQTNRKHLPIASRPAVAVVRVFSEELGSFTVALLWSVSKKSRARVLRLSKTLDFLLDYRNVIHNFFPAVERRHLLAGLIFARRVSERSEDTRAHN